ncbi:hypothetical protein Neosp_002892 [[Neocosmospora] mangrovei]
MEAAASIAGLIALADLVFRYSIKYVQGVKGARKEVEDISREISNLSLVLHRLSFIAISFAETQSFDGTEATSNITLHHLYDCQELLTRLRKRLSDAESETGSESRFKRVQGQLKWPFSSDETKGILQDLERQKQTIDLALAADSLKSLSLLLSRQSTTNSGINQVQDTVTRILDIESKIVLDKKRKSVLGFFTKANPYSEFATNRGLRKGLTGLWLTQGPEFEEWYRTPGSKIWCSGIPGAGKSVLAAAIIDECLQRNVANPGAALAYFFCTYRDEKTQGSVSILSSLCSQLARQDENAFRVLEEYHDELTSERQLPAEASAKKLAKVLRTMCTFFDRVYVIVDGLDECGEHVKESVGTLAALLPSPDEALNLALLSRDEVPIREIVGENFHNIEIEAHTEDIERYVATELEERIASGNLKLGNLSLKDVIMTRLVDGAKGMFRWVACQLDALCKLPRDRDRRKALDKLPPTLFDTYERILAGVNESLEENKQLVQRTLLLISSPYHMRLNLRQICEAISLSDDEEELLDEDLVDGEEVLRLCGSLVRKRLMPYYEGDDDKYGIEFSHFSVQEYLQGPCLEHPTLSAFGVSRGKACSLLASLCLDYLTLKDHKQLLEATSDAEDEALDAMVERDWQRPFYRHAATLWPFYVRECGEEHCLERIHSLFQLSKTPSFCLWAMTLAAHSMSMSIYLEDGQDDLDQWLDLLTFRETTFSYVFDILRPDFTPLHMAAILGMPELCDHLVKQGANMDARGKFGTPLHCAIVGLGIFTISSDGPSVATATFFSEVGQLLGRRQPCQVLLRAKANPQLCFIHAQKETYSSLSLAAMSLCEEYGMEIVIELVKAGITIGKEDLVHFQERYATILDLLDGNEYGEREAVVNLLGVLNPADRETKGTPRSRLYTETYEWAKSMGIVDLDQTSTAMLVTRLSDDKTSDLISTWIRSNDGVELGHFLKSSRSELIKSTKFGSFTGSSLHLATHYGSLDVLKILLEHGLDANMVDETGKTPAHWCFDVDQLQVLLKHGASTLLPDKTQETVWHTAARAGQMAILELLIELDVTQEALKMVSSRNETPICSALNNRQTDAVLFLLKHCNSREFWKSGRSIYRAAAGTGSADIIQHLLDAGIELDGIDDMGGSPLHYLPTNTTIECVQILKGLFPLGLGQRRKEDLRTPLELHLLRAVKDRVVLDRKVLEAMLADSAVSNTKEASSLWSFLGIEVTKSTMSAMSVPSYHSTLYTASLKDYASAFITLGIMAKYEEERGESASLPFMSTVALTATNMYKTTLEATEQPKRYPYWNSISDLTQHVMGQSRHCDSVVGKPAATRFLSLAILHDDMEMVSLLIEKGVDMHSRLDDDELSPLEFACLPNVPVSEKNFALLLKHASPEKISEGNESLLGCGSLHFTAGMGRTAHHYDYDWKLKQMLGAGVDPNLPLSAKNGSPLVYHIRRGIMSTAEMLLEAEADPWARGSYPFDATLEAVASGRHSILAKIMALSGQSPCWDRTWASAYNNTRWVGGNALHLASMQGNTKCLEFYLDRDLLSDLECHDDVFDTPMHYAAHFDRSATIEFLKARGGNIDARNRFGLTPLHLAVDQGHLQTAKTLINLGAKHQACDQGAVPLVYADGLSRIAERSSSQREILSAFVNQRDTQHQQTALHLAAARNNLEACDALINSQADIEQADAINRTPLHFAASSGSLQVAKDLLSRGARANPLDAFAETPLMLAYRAGQCALIDLLTPYHESPMGTNHKGESLLHFMTKFEPGPARKEVSLERFLRCIEQGGNLYSQDTDGVAPVHWILASHSPCYLKSLLDRNCQFLRPPEMTQWPHSCFHAGTHRLVAISKNLHLVRPSLSEQELRQLCGVTDNGSHSLLCQAACWGLVEAIENFLALGVGMIEHECNDHGTPLAAAVFNRQIEAVKCLVRNGATIPHNLCPPADSRATMASPDVVIQQWLFIGRYMDQKQVANETTEDSDKIKSWAGVCSVEVALKWEWKRLWGESTREYACRWQRILKDLRGKVVKCVGETDSKNGGSEDGCENGSDDK